MAGAPDQVLELGAELLDVADIRPHGAVVEGADGRARPAPGHVEDGVQVLFASLALHDAAADLVDPPRGFPTRRALAARFVGIEAGHHHEASGMDTVSSITMMPAEPIMEPLLLGPSTSMGMSISSGVRMAADEPPGTTALRARPPGMPPQWS